MFTSMIAFATPVDGVLSYKLPSGDLITRKVTLEVPARGQGEVKLTGDSFVWKSNNFKSYETLNRKVFSVVFDTEFENQKSKVILKGTYLKGSNYLIYSGDVYKIKSSLEHIGVFQFKYDR